MLLLSLFLALLPAGWSQAGDERPEIDRLVAAARQVLRQDLQSWHGYSFRREVVRRRLDDDGRQVWGTTYDFQVIASSGGFAEELEQIDGRPPTSKEIREHREKARFSKHLSQILSGDPSGRGQPEGLDALVYLLYLANYRYGGLEEVAGVRCHHIRFEASPAPPDAGAFERMAAATEGSLWVTTEGLHTVRGETRLVRPVSRFPIRVFALRLELENEHVGEVWLPRRLEVQSDLRLGVGRRRTYNSYRYSEYRRRGIEGSSRGSASLPAHPSSLHQEPQEEGR